MVIICPYFNEFNFITLRYFKTDVFQRLVHRFAKYYPTVFGRADKVIEKYGNIVTLINIFTHITKVITYPKQSFGELTP